MSKKLVYEVGINDADYVVKIQSSTTVNGKRTRKTVFECPFYVKWKSMLARCYSKKESNKKKSYNNCYVCEKWLTFSNFRKWMISQDWEGKHLDKDLLYHGNREYSSDKCIFVDYKINYFISCGKGYRSGKLPIGVYTSKTGGFYGRVSNLHGTGYIRDHVKYNTSREALFYWYRTKRRLVRELLSLCSLSMSTLKDIILCKITSIYNEECERCNFNIN